MSNGQAEWIVDPEKHKQALEVFDLYVNKKKQITDIAKEMGFGEEKTATILHDDPEYIQRFTIDQSETVIVTPVPTLFTPEQQAQIREILSHNRKWRSRVHDYALAHFVRCGLCGTTYHGSAIKNNAKSLSKLKHYRYYQHCHRFKTDLCISRVSAPVIEEAAFFVIGQIFSSQEKLREAIDVATQNTRDAKTRLIAESLELKKETERLSKQKQNLIDAVMNGVLTQEDIATRIQKIGGALAEAKTKIKSNDVLLKNLEAQVSDDLAERIQRMFLQLTGMYGTVNEWNHDLKVRLLKWFFGMGKDNGVFIRHQPNMPNNLVFSIIGNFGPTAMAYVDKDNDCGAMYDTFYSLSPGELRSFESANNNTTLGDLRGIISESLAHDF
ncbi:MAG: zinc ribbon domain-containing protein [Candidatus Competibacter sp.]